MPSAPDCKPAASVSERARCAPVSAFEIEVVVEAVVVVVTAVAPVAAAVTEAVVAAAP